MNAVLAVSNDYYGSFSGQQGIAVNQDIKEVLSINSFIEGGLNTKWYQPYAQDLDIVQDSTGMGGYVITLAKKVFGSTSLKSQGNLFFYLNYNKFSDMLGKVKINHGGCIYVIGNDGNLIINPRNENHFGLSIGDLNQGDKEQFSYLNADIIKKIKTQQSSVFTDELYGKNMLITFSTIDTIGDHDLGWTVVTVTEIKRVTEGVSKIAYRVILIGLTCLVLGIFFTWFVNRDITKNIRLLVNRMEKVSCGNISIDYVAEDRKDEIGRLSNSFAKMIQNLNGLIRSIKEASNITVDASTNVSSKIQQTYVSIEETNAILDMIRKKSVEQDSIVKEGKGRVLTTRNQIDQAKDTMDNVDSIISKSKVVGEDNKKSVVLLEDMSRDVRMVMEEIGEKSKELIYTSSEITKFTRKIKEIADQTRLIALNSAIEAARLGAEGRGFNLLSEEARNLATKIKDFSGNIDSIIRNLIDKIHDTNNVVKKLGNVVEESEDSIENITKSFDKNIDFLDDVAMKISGIKNAFAYIDSFVQEIITTVGYISSSSQSNIQDISEVSEAMNEQMKCQESLMEQTTDLLNLSQDLKKKSEEIY